MTEELKTSRYVELLDNLKACISRRLQHEKEAEPLADWEDAAEERSHQETLQQLEDAHTTQAEELEQKFNTIENDAHAENDAESLAAEQEKGIAVREVNKQYEVDAAAAIQEYEDNRWMVSSVLDESSDDSPKSQYEGFKSSIISTKEQQQIDWKELEEKYNQSIEVMKKRKMWRDFSASEQPEKPVDREEAEEYFTAAITQARSLDSKVNKQLLSKLFSGFVPFLLFVVSFAVLYVIVYFTVDPNLLGNNAPKTDPSWLAMSAVIVFGICFVVMIILYGISAKISAGVWERFQQSMTDARYAHQAWVKMSKTELTRRKKEFQVKHAASSKQLNQSLAEYDATHEEKMAALNVQHQADLEAANENYPKRIAKFNQLRDEKIQQARTEYETELAAATKTYDAGKSAETGDRNSVLTDRQRSQVAHWDKMESEWKEGVKELQLATEQMSQSSAEKFDSWKSLAAPGWSSTLTVPQAIRLGEYAIDLERIEDGVSPEERLATTEKRFPLPALVPFPSTPSLLLKASGEGREVAVQALQVAMLRMLTLIPAGKLRFTLFDPVGLGENFSAFMHLADYDELLITNRIWTEATQFEQKLADLTAHMENIFQKYLRNEFKTIEEYNDFAGEVAEPYHILVIANFPTNFTDNAARRLASIASSGAQCGVYTLISVDTNQKLPHGFDLADLEQYANVFEWKNNEFHSAQPELAALPLVFDAPPPPEEFTNIVKNVGEASKDMRRVEVSFERVAPKNGELWSMNSAAGIDCPLGRAGAMKLQHMKLGKGTSQHVLVAGKTGSGKSTFLHALITNLALFYSPDEIEFFLIDFKKGVEFKTYATAKMPHARVIAIESDREFGVSALQRLDGILKERGDLFRDAGVQDIAGYRKARPDEVMPRVLLIIDEFQEFFVEDDKISQAAAQLFDRLVRQGRAFGVHVLLGSQTLGGAYSLARSTLGQIAVRVALQCSESDAHLILSEDNTAARLLTRPGEAIYNDANGMVEGNNPFQVAWLDDEQRDEYLATITRLSEERGITRGEAIVYEGNIPSDPKQNDELVRCITTAAARGRAGERPAATFTPHAWLGEAVAIKDPTVTEFRRQSAKNVLIVGESSEAALGIVSTTLISLAAQLPLVAVEKTTTDAPALEEPTSTTSESTDSASDEPAFGSGRNFELEELGAGSGDWGSSDDTTSVAGNATLTDGSNASFYFLNGSMADSVEQPLIEELTISLNHPVTVAGVKDSDPIIAKIASEVQRRQTAGGEGEPPVFLFIFNMSRFRDLRKSDDDFGFGASKSSEKSSSQMFQSILTDGPENGIYTIIWCDSYNNVDRWFSRQTMRELEMRIVFQVNAGDSSNLIDSPAASKLGPNRAILYLEEKGSIEKFRPYAKPTAEWLGWVKEQLQG